MYDVAIVGAGPVGLFLACELGLAGCSVVVLEQELEPGSPWRTAPLGRRGVNAASAEAFYRRGLMYPLLAASGDESAWTDPDADSASDPGSDAPAPRRGLGHFAGLMADPGLVDFDALPFRLPTKAVGGAMTSLDAVESVLTERALKLGVEIRRGVTVSDVAQDNESVVLRSDDEEFVARWAVGCDGGRSVVRGLAGFDFVGTEPKLTGYLMLATVADPEKLQPGFTLTPYGMYILMGTEGYIGMMDMDGGAFDRTQQPSREHLQEVLRRVSGTDVTLTEVQLASTFTDRAKQATTYRQGRVLLAGDAAHIHSPLGGQGLNTGIGDAMNLGWKLAAVARGTVPEELLDTYTTERHPVGEWVLNWTRAQVAVMGPDAHSQAIQAVMRDLMQTPDGATYVYQQISRLGVRYDLGDEHPLVGRNAPDFLLEDGTYLAELLESGLGVLLDFDGSLAGFASSWEGRIRYAAGPARDDLGLRAVLVRPDGIVVWAGSGDFGEAATRWFGLPEEQK